jgi:hypothetical protein
MPTNDKTKKVVPNTSSVHVVFFSCGNCGEETEHIQFCPDCGKPMRVIDVVEKFGSEADTFIKTIQDRVDKGVISPDDYVVTDEEEVPNIIVLGEDDHDSSNLDDGAVTDDDDAVLIDIFPEEDGEDEKTSDPSKDLTDLDGLVEALDEEEDDMDIPGFGDDGIPEL